MRELEKILEEIEQRVNYCKEHATLEYVDICAGLREAEGIIRKHMNDGWITIGTYNSMQRKWNVNEYITNLGIDVKAWQPLPEPYHPERSKK